MELEIRLHDVPARSLEHIVSYLDSDDPHVRSKVTIQIKDDAGNYYFTPFPFTPFSDQQ